MTCKAEQMSDQMVCVCGNVWDMNDTTPPACREREGGDLQYDPVTRPCHYNQGSIECIDAIGAATVGKSGIEVVCTANVIKYLWRYERKNGVEDVRKARWYLERLIKELEHA